MVIGLGVGIVLPCATQVAKRKVDQGHGKNDKGQEGAETATGGMENQVGTGEFEEEPPTGCRVTDHVDKGPNRNGLQHLGAFLTVLAQMAIVHGTRFASRLIHANVMGIGHGRILLLSLAKRHESLCGMEHGSYLVPTMHQENAS